MTKIPAQTLRLHMADCLGISASRSHCYRLAGSVLVADAQIGLLEGFRVRCPEPMEDGGLGGDDPGEGGDERGGIESCIRPTGSVIRSHGWLAGKQRNVINRVDCQHHTLHMTGIGRFAIDRSNGNIRCLKLNMGLSSALAEEALLGPPTALAMALRGTWCLHASAVTRAGQASLFLGASGRGKSTLAGYLDDHGEGKGEGRTTRLTDDISPCALGGHGAVLLPHFPQPKLGDAENAVARPGNLPLKSIFVLEPAAKDKSSRLESVAPAQAMRALANQTVAVNLFDRELHQRHLRFLAGLVQSTRVFRLEYPHDYDKLPAVSALLSGYL